MGDQLERTLDAAYKSALAQWRKCQPDSPAWDLWAAKVSSAKEELDKYRKQKKGK